MDMKKLKKLVNLYKKLLISKRRIGILKQVDELPSKNQALCVFCVTCIVLVCVVLFCFTLLYSLCYYKLIIIS